MANTLPKGSIFYSGHGQAGNWSDPANWAGGVVPTGTAGTAVFTSSATLNGSFAVGQVMLLGTEAITVNGTLSTLSDNHCTSMMACDGAVVTFTPTSVLNDSGGLLVGVNAVGSFTAEGSGSLHASINSVDGKLGKNAGGSGTVTINDSAWHASGNVFVGLAGQGDLVIGDAGTVTVGGSYVMGADAGAVGHATLSGGSQLSVTGNAIIGADGAGGTAGTGTLTIDSGSTFTGGQIVRVGMNSALILAGGTVNATSNAAGIQLDSTGTLSGNGTVSVPAGHATINDMGLIQASGGTLTLNGPVTGGGHVQIAADSTLVVNGASIGVPTIAFSGSNGTLALAHGIMDHATITGFASGDSILMAGVDSMSFNATSDILTLSAGTQVVDHLKLAGTYASTAFTFTETSAGGIISFAPTHS